MSDVSEDRPVRVGIIGRGFGEQVMAPALASTEGCEVVEVVSPRDPAAVAGLCGRADVDLISVHSPPFMHLEHVRLAVEGGHAVLCDKPFGRDAPEAAKMCDLAERAGVVNLVNFQFRHDPEREKLRQLVCDGVVGEPEHVLYTMFTTGSRTPLRQYGWLFDRDLGGGWLGALGSHVIDFVRWSFGEIVNATGTLRTVIAERPDADGELHRCTADDGFTATMATKSGVTATLDSSFASSVNTPPYMAVVGSDGVLELRGDHRITLLRDDGSREVFEVCGGAGPLAAAMSRWTAVICDAVRGRRLDLAPPTFADGLACTHIIDQIRS